MKYRKKPVVIEAVQWNGLNLKEVKDFVGDSLIYDICDTAWKVGKTAPIVDMKIKTLEGNMQVSIDDYIIKGVQEEFYPCKPDIFEQTYEKADLAKENLRKAQIEEQKIMRQKEIANAYEAARESYKYANELRKKFCEDYGYYCASETKTVNHKDLTDFFSLFFN